MSNDNSIDYKGPSTEWKPPIGGNMQTRAVSTRGSNQGYHDLDYLRDLLRRLLEEANAQISTAEERLARYNLKIDENTKLEDAHKAEWPVTLGSPANYISYAQYKSLEVRGTAAANFIRKTYEEYIRGPSGTNALDILMLVQTMKNEATNIEGFLDDYIGEVDDSSEHRALELLQDWAENAINALKKTDQVYNLEGSVASKTIPVTELDQIDPQRAAEFQALFQVKLNAINGQITQMQEDLKKDYSTLSSVYFNKFLGPALKFRLNAMKNIETLSSVPGVLGEEAFQADKTVNGNLQVLLSDQLKRNRTFEDKMNRVQLRLVDRDTYTNYIKQLSTKGKSIPAQFSDVPISANENKAFTDITAAGKAPSSVSFDPDHNRLSGVLDDFAHPQYILKSGGTITGDLLLEDGIRVGGIEPAYHRHNGLDGSTRISGGAISGGSMPSSVVDPDDVPTMPGGMRVVTQTPRTVPPGITVIDVTVVFDGNESYTYELQVTRVVD